MKIKMDVKKFATIFAGVLLATNALSTLARADDTGKPTPDARVGNVLFQTPNPKI